jgi:hypothetical protein
MKRLALALVFLLAATPAFAWPGWVGDAVITIATDNNTSAVVTFPANIKKIALQVPTIDSGTIKLQVSVDGTTYQDLYCPVAATGASVLWTTASGTGAATFEVPCSIGLWKYVRLEASAEQAANRTIRIVGGE